MAVLRTVIDYQETSCRFFVWEGTRSEHVLQSSFQTPLQIIPADQPEEERARILRANGHTIRQAVRATGLKIREARVVIPKQWVTLRVVTLPSTDPAEIAEMASFEAQRYIPFNVERHIVDHRVLRSEGLQGSRVLIVAVDGPPASNIVTTFDAAGIRVAALDVSSLALTNALMSSGKWVFSEHPTIAHLDIGLTTTDINVLHQGILIFARSIGVGVDNIFVSPSPELPARESIGLDQISHIDLLREVDAGENESEELLSKGKWVRRMVSEVRRTFEFAHREFACDPLTQVYLSGAGSQLQGIEQVLQTSLGTDVAQLDPFGEGLEADPEAIGEGLPPSACALAVGALQADLSPDKLRVNLLPADYLRRYMSSKRRKSLVVTSSLAAVFVILFFFTLSQVVEQREKMLEFYQQQVTASERRARELEYRKTVIRILRANRSQQGSALAILNTLSGWGDLFSDANMRVSLEEFSYSAGNDVRLRGYVWEYSDLNNFVQYLRESGHFIDVRNEEQPRVNWPNRSEEVVRFRTRCFFDRDERSY